MFVCCKSSNVFTETFLSLLEISMTFKPYVIANFIYSGEISKIYNDICHTGPKRAFYSKNNDIYSKNNYFYNDQISFEERTIATTGGSRISKRRGANCNVGAPTYYVGQFSAQTASKWKHLDRVPGASSWICPKANTKNNFAKTRHSKLSYVTVYQQSKLKAKTSCP